MHKLANFSVETDTIVLLQFQDGQQSRVAITQLPQHLTGADLKRVQAALKLRRDFLKTHLPKMGLMLATGVGLATLFIGGHKLAAELMVPHRAPVTTPMHEDVAQMVAPASTPEITLPPKPAVKDAVVVAKKPKPKPSLAPAPRAVHLNGRVAVKPVEPVKLQLTVPAVGLSLELPTTPLTSLLGLAPPDSQPATPPADAPLPALTDQSATPDASLSQDGGEAAQ